VGGKEIGPEVREGKRGRTKVMGWGKKRELSFEETNRAFTFEKRSKIA